MSVSSKDSFDSISSHYDETEQQIYEESLRDDEHIYDDKEMTGSMEEITEQHGEEEAAEAVEETKTTVVVEETETIETNVSKKVEPPVITETTTKIDPTLPEYTKKPSTKPIERDFQDGPNGETIEITTTITTNGLNTKRVVETVTTTKKVIKKKEKAEPRDGGEETNIPVACCMPIPCTIL